MQLQIIARERDERKRAEFRRFTSQFQPEQFLFVDESSKDERTTQVRCKYSNRHRNNAVVSETSAWGRAGFGGDSLKILILFIHFLSIPATSMSDYTMENLAFVSNQALNMQWVLITLMDHAMDHYCKHITHFIEILKFMSKVAWLGRLFVVVVFIEWGWGCGGLGPVKSLTLDFPTKDKG